MRDKSLGIIAALALILFVVLYSATKGYSHDQVNIGALELSGRRSSEVVALINASSTSTVGNYTALDAPRGTAYSVPAGKTLYVYAINWTNATSTALTLLAGYADARVTNSATTTNFVLLFSTTGKASDAATLAPAAIAIPAGKYPTVLLQGGGGPYPTDVMAYGLTR